MQSSSGEEPIFPLRKVTQMPKNRKPRKTHSVDIRFSDEKATSFGGMILEHRLASRLGLWRQLEKRLPDRSGTYSWLDIIQSAVAGLLTGSRGSFATEDVRKDEALLDMLEIPGAPEEATFWRALEGLGEMSGEGLFAQTQAEWTREILSVLPRRDLLECEGFLPVFLDGSLLEGSRRREGTKHIKDKGAGLMWTTVFAGPLVAAQALAKKGEGEQSLGRRLLPLVNERVLKPLNLQSKALVLADSLHGKDPSLQVMEDEGLHYVVGAGALAETGRLLQERSEAEWHELGPNPKRGWASSALCLCWIQCADWAQKRLLVGRRVLREGEMFFTYYGVLTNLTEADLKTTDGVAFAKKIWRLYDAKGRMELGYQELLSDLGLHHPPCQEHLRNAGFYSVATLAHTLGVGVKLIGESSSEQRRREGKKSKQEGAPARIHVRARRGMRLWRVRRKFFALPARVSRHARRLRLDFLGVAAEVRLEFERWHQAICSC